MAEQYDAARPSYPRELIDDLIALAPVRAGERVLEVGAGTGKATRLLAERGLSVLALEPDSAMAAVARRSCDGMPVEVLEMELERRQPTGERFALVVSAQAWHWTDPALRYRLAREALRDGGALAAFWNIADWPSCALCDAVDEAYRGIEFPVHPGPMLPRGERSAIDEDWRREIEATEGFTAAEVREYEWEQPYTTPEYLALLGTHSDHIMLADVERRALFDRVGAAIDANGGTLVMPYVTRLCLARALRPHA